MKTKLTILAAASAALFAQESRAVFVGSDNAKPMTVDFIGSSAMSITGRSVKGLPYAAEAVNETSRTLPDGNRISRKTTNAVYRDSQGRTRNEIAMPAVGPWASAKGEKIVNIFDPVAKVSIMLHPDKTANKHEVPSVEGMNWSESVSAGGQTRTMVFARSADGGAKKITEDVIIERLHGPEVVVADSPQAGVRMRTGATASGSANAKHTFRKESLGKKLIEGVEAEGTRTVSVIPAGEIGNERDIEIVDETWFSKEIEALVYSRHADPQTGETTYRLTNIQRGEQPLHLFEVPADYKLNTDNLPRRMDIKIRRAPGNE
jgi:hypothetical protein